MDIFKEIEKLAQELEGSEPMPQNEEEVLMKLAQDATDGLVKTAEEAQIFHLGRIFGQGMAVGMLEKIAQEMGEAMAEAAAAAASMPVSADLASPEVVEQQIPAEDIDDSEFVKAVSELKKIVRSMTPAEIIAWYNSLPEDSKAIVDADPELSAMVEEAHKMIAAQGGAQQAPEAVEQPE